VWDTTLGENLDQYDRVIIIIHRDGRFPIDERDYFLNRFPGKTVVHVEIVKNTPGLTRLYGGGGTKQPPAGTFLPLNDNEGILVSQDAKIGTARPIHVRMILLGGEQPSREALTQVAQDIFHLSYLQYGSLWLKPKLPITTGSAHKAAKLNELRKYKHGEQRYEDECDPIPQGRQQYWL